MCIIRFICPGTLFRQAGDSPILRSLESEGVKATFFTPAWTAEHHPDVIRAIAELGHEVSYQGYLHEVCDTYEKKMP